MAKKIIAKESLQIAAGLIISESGLTKDAKINLLNYVQREADSYQLMALLLDGKVTSLDESSRKIMKERFINSEWKNIILEFNWQTIKTAPSAAKAAVSNAWKTGGKSKVILGGVGIAASLFAAYKAATIAFSKAHRTCWKTVEGSKQRSLCLAHARVKLADQKIAILHKVRSTECSKKENPAKCHVMVDKKIESLSTKKAKNEEIIRKHGEASAA